HYFKSSTMAAEAGHYKVGEVYYDFDETGCIASGVWGRTLNGVRYYYGPSYYQKGWQEIDGNRYYFKNSYRYEGICQIVESNSDKMLWFDFGTDGICRNAPEGLYKDDDGLHYILDGVGQRGLWKVDGDYYFFNYSGCAVSGKVYAYETHCDLPMGNYEFGTDGKMLNGIVTKDDGTYYYTDGKLGKTVGLTKVGDDYYFVCSDGKCSTGLKYAWETNCDLPCGNYEFGTDGKMLNGVVTKDDATYYYENGKVSTTPGLTKVGDDYYFVCSDGTCATGLKYAWATNCDLKIGNYEFGADGKMYNGIVTKDDATYYYINGKLGTTPGLTKVGDDYYFVCSNGTCATGLKYAWATNCDLPMSNYEFGDDGKMLNGIVTKEDGTYYYTDGKLGKTVGLTKVGDDYYFVCSDGKCATGLKYAWATNCDLPMSNYEFGDDGKLLNGIVTKEDATYYYTDGKLGKTVGLTKVGDDYYFVCSDGKCATGEKYAWATNCDLPMDHYVFCDDGKLLNGFVTKDDGIYYYENGKPGKVGLNYVDGNYYFVRYGGKLVTNQSYYAWETNDILLESTYTFDEQGRIVK
ncbi:MAG: hypothetical protein ACI4QE_04970, partial [Acutalibacteraceae bacterium]